MRKEKILDRIIYNRKSILYKLVLSLIIIIVMTVSQVLALSTNIKEASELEYKIEKTITYEAQKSRLNSQPESGDSEGADPFTDVEDGAR